MKKIIAIVLAFLFSVSLTVISASAASVSLLDGHVSAGIIDADELNDTVPKENSIRTVSHPNETYAYTQETNPVAGQGAFSITRGTLVTGDVRTPIYLVAVHGLEGNAKGQTATDESCLNAGTEQESIYLDDLIQTIQNNVPQGSNLIIAGHSLGGMVSQQAAANPKLQEDYNILYVITFGSPLLSKDKTEGEVNRMVASGDVVPYLSIYTLNDLDSQINDRHRESVNSLPLISHVLGYKEAEAWKDYDALGVKNGNAVLEMDDSTTTRFYAPEEDLDYSKSAWISVNVGGMTSGYSFLF